MGTAQQLSAGFTNQKCIHEFIYTNVPHIFSEGYNQDNTCILLIP
jgi:hypothetical protein